MVVMTSCENTLSLEGNFSFFFAHLEGRINSAFFGLPVWGGAGRVYLEELIHIGASFYRTFFDAL